MRQTAAVRVALDVRTMQASLRGGIGRSYANLVPRLSETVELHLLTDRRYPRLESSLPQTQLRTPVPGVSLSWLQLSVPPFLRGFDGVFHCPYYALPNWLPVPGVVGMHDLTFEHFPEWFSPVHGPAHRWQARRAAKTAAVILTGTEFIRQDIIETYRVAPDRVLVSPQGVDPVFAPGCDAPALLAQLDVERPFVVAMGGAQRRNLPLAVQAWQFAVRAGMEIDLVAVGPEQPAPEPGLHWAGPVPDGELAALLASSSGFLYPTAYEGFGMPGLEALGAGAPVIAARSGSVPEVLGQCAQWALSLSPEHLGAALVDLLSDPLSAAGLRARGLVHAAGRPGWDEAAAAHLLAYRMAAAG